MSMSKTCPHCGAEETERSDPSGYVRYECRSVELGGKFTPSDTCKQRLLADARPEDHADRQRRVLDISDKILKHAAELRELAVELDGMGCACNTEVECVGSLVGPPPRDGQHASTCPRFLAWVLHSHDGLEPPEGSRQPSTPPPHAKDIRHLTPPFPHLQPVTRATCPECQRYARRENQIPHTEECSKKQA